MATPAEIQAQGDPANTLRVYQIQRSIKLDGTYDSHYVVGTGDPYSGRSMWARTTSGDSAADQNTAILAALTAGPVDTNALDN